MTDPADIDTQPTDCSGATRWLHDYLAGELDEAQRAAIALHLQACPPCVQAFDFESQLRIVISARAGEIVPPGVRARILRRLSDPAG